MSRSQILRCPDRKSLLVIYLHNVKSHDRDGGTNESVSRTQHAQPMAMKTRKKCKPNAKDRLTRRIFLCGFTLFQRSYFRNTFVPSGYHIRANCIACSGQYLECFKRYMLSRLSENEFQCAISKDSPHQCHPHYNAHAC